MAAKRTTPPIRELLSAQESRDLLVRRLGERRVAAESEAVDQIIVACARLPLALAVAAAQAATHPDVTLAGLAADLRASHSRLSVLDTGDTATNTG